MSTQRSSIFEARPRSVSLIRCRGPLPITPGRSPVRVRSVTCCPTSTCGSHVAERANPQQSVVVGVLLLDVGDDQADLVQVPEQQHRRAGFGAHPGVGVAEDVTADARERRRVGTPDGGRRLLVARGAVGAQEVVQKRPGRRQHGRDATITLAWIRIRSSSRASGRSRPSERRSRRRGTRSRRAPAALVPSRCSIPSRIACEVAAEVKGFDAEERFGRREARKMDRVTALSLAAAREAWENAGAPAVDPSRGGVVVRHRRRRHADRDRAGGDPGRAPGPAVAALPAELPRRHADQLHRHRPRPARPQLRRRLGLRDGRPRDRRGGRDAAARRGRRDPRRRRRLRRASRCCWPASPS